MHLYRKRVLYRLHDLPFDPLRLRLKGITSSAHAPQKAFGCMAGQGQRKPEHQRRSAQVTFWVTPAERDRISANAERAGVTMSAYIRSLALGKPLRQKPSVQADELIRQLSRIGNNLNQLLAHAHDGKIAGEEHIEHVFKRVSKALTYWTSGEVSRGIAPEAITLLGHEGTKLNGLARQANRGELVSEDMNRAGFAGG